MIRPTLIEQLLNLEAKVLAMLDMEDINHYLFNLKQVKETHVNYTSK